jgi:hypothetical protein
VKKYLRPGSSPVHSSRSESCVYPAAFSLRFDSSSLAGSNSRTESVQSAPTKNGRKEKQRRGRLPTAWKAVGDALRKSTRSETTGAMAPAEAMLGGGGGDAASELETEARADGAMIDLVRVSVDVSRRLGLVESLV